VSSSSSGARDRERCPRVERFERWTVDARRRPSVGLGRWRRSRVVSGEAAGRVSRRRAAATRRTGTTSESRSRGTSEERRARMERR
jgi:hypothetical protein